MSRSKRWCFTLNNPTLEESEFLLRMHRILKTMKTTSIGLTYLVSGQEVVTTPHIQGYLECKKISLQNLKENFLTRAHWEIAKGTPKEASEYCKKDGTFEESGVLSPGRGARTDLQEIKKEIEQGNDELTIAQTHFERWVVYRRSFQRYSALLAKKRSWPTIVQVHWGKTGTGKTRFVMDQIMDLTFWIPGDYKWFDGYTGQRIVIFDDYRGEYALQLLLKLCDRYPMHVPIKGGFTEWAPTKIYITSNIHPKEWYPDADGYSVAAMFRRFNLVSSVFDNIYQ